MKHRQENHSSICQCNCTTQCHEWIWAPPFQTADRHRIKHLALNRGLGQRNRVRKTGGGGKKGREEWWVCAGWECILSFKSLGMEIIQFVLNGNKTFIALTFHTPNETFEHKVRWRLHCASRKIQTIIKRKKCWLTYLAKMSLFAAQWMLDWQSFEKDVCSPRLARRHDGEMSPASVCKL